MILVVVGPTGVGKTKMSEALALKYNAVIFNADSMQVYKGLDIGTAKVREDEKEDVIHELFDIVDVNDMYTVFDYQRDGRKLLDKYKDKNIVIVGGTGLYIKALLYDYVFDIEEETTDEFENYSNKELKEMADKIDPNNLIHENNRKRLVRFINKNGNSDSNGDKLLYDAKFIGLTTSRDVLYDRINKRVDIMVEDGLLDEVKNFYDKKIKSKSIMTGIGYKELYEYFDGTVSLEEALDNIKKRSRKYAKRQYTWFNNQMDINWFDVDFSNFENTIDDVIKFIED